MEYQSGKPEKINNLSEPCLKAKETNWTDFTQKKLINNGARNHINRVNDQFFDTIKRPKNSMLNIKDFEKDFQHIMEPWQAGVDLAFLEMNK